MKETFSRLGTIKIIKNLIFLIVFISCSNYLNLPVYPNEKEAKFENAKLSANKIFTFVIQENCFYQIKATSSEFNPSVKILNLNSEILKDFETEEDEKIIKSKQNSVVFFQIEALKDNPKENLHEAAYSVAVFTPEKKIVKKLLKQEKEEDEETDGTDSIDGTDSKDL